MGASSRSRVAIACQGGGSHTVFSAGVLQELLGRLPEDVDVVALSGTSGGAMCAALAWDGLLRGDPHLAGRETQELLGRGFGDRALGQDRQSDDVEPGEPAESHGPARGEPLPPADLGRGAVPRHPQPALRFRRAAEARPPAGRPGAAHRRGRGPYRPLRGLQGR